MAVETENIAAQENAAAAAQNAGGVATPVSGSYTPPAQFSPYDYGSRVAEINRMYDSHVNAQKANLEASYNQNLSNLEANRAKIAQQYQTQRNANAVEYERQRRNFNQQAMMNGLNTGAASQASLAQNSMYNRGQAAIGAAEGAANAELERSIADLKVQYQNDINSAIAQNDYNRAAALLDEYNNAYSMAMTKAQTLAQYGDFSGYADLYGQGAAGQMTNMWNIQNPLAAYNMGRISAARYRQITGQYAPGTEPRSSGRYYGGGGSSSGNGNGEGNLDEFADKLGGGDKPEGEEKTGGNSSSTSGSGGKPLFDNYTLFDANGYARDSNNSDAGTQAYIQAMQNARNGVTVPGPAAQARNAQAEFEAAQRQADAALGAAGQNFFNFLGRWNDETVPIRR